MPAAIPQPQSRRAARRPPAPLGLLALGLLGGIFFDRSVAAPAAPYLFGMLLAALLLAWPFARRECIKVIVVLLAFCIGGLSQARQVRRLPADHILQYTQDTPMLARVSGTVVSEPRLQRKRSSPFSPWWHGSPRTYFLVDVDSVETVEGPEPASGTVKVAVKEPILTLVVGERVQVTGWCFRPRPPGNPGQFDSAEYDRRRGVFVNVTGNHRECVRRLDAEPRPVTALWARVRQRVRALLLDDMLAAGGPEATLLDTMVLGRRGAVDPAINEGFISIGCAHYLAVSGMHVGMIGLFVWFVGRALGASVRGCAGAVIVISVFYAFIADPRPPVLRATVMTVAVCVGLVLGRPRNFLNGLSLAAIVILLVRPSQLFDVGFQLSFAAVLAIVYVSPVLMDIPRRLRPAVVRRNDDDGDDLFVKRPSATGVVRAWRRIELRCWWMLSASMAAWMASVPATLVYFDRFSPWGWLTSLLLFPLVLALMVASFAKLLWALAWPTLASVLTIPVQWLASALITAVGWFEQLPTVPLSFSTPPWWLAGLAGAALISWAGRHRWAHGKRAALVLTSVVLLAATGWLFRGRGDGRLIVTVLSVGRGTSIVLELPDGQVVLYDAGASGPYDPGHSTIVPFLRRHGIRRIDAVIISHPNLDHFSGLLTVIDRVCTGPVYVSPYFAPLSTGASPSRTLLEELRARDHPVRVVDDDAPPLVFGEVTFEILWPPADLGDGITSNETSIVTRVSFAGRSMLLTGDIEALAQTRLMAHPDLRADVLELPHHGSVRHNTREFIEAVDPEVLISSTFVRSADRDAEFDRIAVDRRHFNTADHGAVTLALDPTGIGTRTYRTPVDEPIRLQRRPAVHRCSSLETCSSRVDRY